MQILPIKNQNFEKPSRNLSNKTKVKILEKKNFGYLSKKFSSAYAQSPRKCSNIEILAKISSLGRYVFGSEISYNKAPPRLPGLGC